MPDKKGKKSKLAQADKVKLAEIDSSPRKVYVSFCVFGTDLDPDEITSRMGLAPTDTRQRGDISAIMVEPCKESAWILSSKSLDSRWLKKHFEWLLPQLVGKKDVIRQLRDEGYRMSVSCYWLAASDNAEAHINTGTMQELANLGLDFWLDVYMSDGME